RHGTSFKSYISSHKRCIWKSLKNITGDVISIFSSKIQVKIGRGAAIGIDKSFKIQIQLDRIYIGDSQYIRYDRIGRTLSPIVRIVFRFRIFDDIEVDQKTRDKPQVNNRLLFFNDTS